MKIRYQFTNYPYSKSATAWSQFRNSMTAGTIFVVGLLVLGINYLLKAILGGPDRYVIALIVGIAIHMGFLIFCRHREEVCAVCDLEKQRLGRDLTPDEKRKALQTLKEQKRAAKNRA